ncbi:hypothetical protein T01_14599 [Trichinella spiralis]|uniref:Uncharacterized protein n=1 Tax=Trichinella spiralis TaxID=6334 RepID=A0A0V1BLC7_TRISP|nr:hypothetical protein T01_14599 [Trichinella spiralis]
MENLANKPSKRISVCFPAPLNIHHSEDRRMNTRLFLDSRLSRLAVSLDQFQEEKGITAQKGKSVLHIHRNFNNGKKKYRLPGGKSSKTIDR